MPVSSTFEAPGSPFLLPYLLASSWTWLALSLATIATLLRALPIFNLPCFRLRRSPLPCSLPPPTALPSSAGRILGSSSSCRVELRFDISSPLAVERKRTFSKALVVSGQKSVLRRTGRSKSYSALQKLLLQHHKNAGVLRSGMGLLSCVLDTEIAFTLEEFPNSNSHKMFNDYLTPQLYSADAKVSAGRRTNVSCESQKQGRSFVQRPQEGERGLSCEGVTDSLSKSCFRDKTPFVEENRSGYERLPPWAFSLLKSVQPFAIPAFGPSNPRYFERDSSFEKQFGWDGMLLTRLGSSWQCKGQTIRASAGPRQGRHGRDVVKVWSVQQKALLKKLDIAESTTSALEAGWRNSLACVGTKMGEISLWDVEKGICVSRIRPRQTPVSALFMDSANEMTFVGSTVGGGGDMVLGLWDHRSMYEPVFHFERTPTAHIPISCLKFRGNDLCVGEAGALSMHDIRKPNRNPIASFSVESARQQDAATAPANIATEEDPACVWESEASFASEEDEEYWDDWTQTEVPEAVSSKKSGSSSFMSRCVGLIRSLSSSSSLPQSESKGD